MLSMMMLIASIAGAPSFACGPTNSQVEAAICSDPELAAYDRAMALTYPRMKPGLRATQRAWLAERDKCASAKRVQSCIRRAYAGRLTEFGMFSSDRKAANAVGITFARVKEYGPGELKILDIGGGEFVYYLSFTRFNFDRDPDHPDEVSDDTFGVLRMRDGIGRQVATNECRFSLKQHGKGWIVSNSDICGGKNNTPDGLYLPVR